MDRDACHQRIERWLRLDDKAYGIPLATRKSERSQTGTLGRWNLGGTMLHTETQDSAEALICGLEGRFTGDGAERVRILTEVTFIDSVDEATLSAFGILGSKFLAEDAFVLDVCERLDRR